MSDQGLEPGSSLGIATVPNLRDVGGYPVASGGTVRRGILYRSVALDHVDGPDVAALAALGVTTVFDLRTAAEREAAPDRLPAGAHTVVLDVLADSADSAPAQLIAVMNDPVEATRTLSGRRVYEIFDQAYREFVTLDSARQSFAAFVRAIATDDGMPAIVHCTTGKDRTGWATAVTLLALGVSEELVMADYLLTNELLIPALQPVIDSFEAAGGDPAVLLPVLGVEREYLQTALDLVRERHGSIDGYLREGLGIDDTTLAALRARFIEPA
ncbi:tyrosine-protein phosphatase [Compostimonas suwonensis]|uniref:Protein-tyrosine phosphatase n=1 Tax=Compostimonas suwonensis TaxID=1048394 RepID=A0A2M9BYR8_9MICO|nr:tyrosine-protein phosphatase [Compostimonas suwonensis]PJJ63231.1 protein-tyrosine phosphatase [Compostimonas suwonensis]